MYIPISRPISERFVFADIDGTILTSDHSVSRSTSDTCRALYEQRVRLILASARMPASILKIQRNLGVREAMICYNGSLILDRDGVTIYNRCFCSDTFLEVLNTISEHPVSNSFFSEQHWLVKAIDSRIRQESDIVGILPEVGQISAVTDCTNKILCIGSPSQVHKLYEDIKSSGLDVIAEKSKPTYLEISPSGSGKFEACKFFLNHFHSPAEKAYAIGDGENDIGMFQCVGVAIAMGNATDSVKSVAQYVTASNDNEGFSLAMRNYVF